MLKDMNIIERGVRGIFGREFITRQRKAKYDQYCTVVDSDKQTEKYNAISTIPQLAEVTDERVLAGFSDYSYELTNKTYMNGIRIPRSLFEFDQTGQIRTLVQSCGARVANFPDKLVASVLENNPNCFDGTPLIGSTHDLGDGDTQTNTFSGGLTDALLSGNTKSNRDDAVAAIQLDFQQVKAQLLDFHDDRGEPWFDEAEPESLMIICHPYAEFYIRTALEAAVISDTSNIMLKSVAKILTVNRQGPFKVGGTFRKGTWYLMKVDTPIRPLIFQRFGPKTNFPDTIPEGDQKILQALNSVEVQTIMSGGSNISETTFFNDEYLLGARVVYSAGCGMWQNIIKVNGAAS